MLNVCLVGYMGYWGRILKRNIEACRKMQLVAQVDEAHENSLAVGRINGYFSSLADALEGMSDFDAVIIATPPETHYELACEAIDAGKHVLIEKPMCTNSADAEDLLKRAKAANVKVGVDHTFLFSQHIRVIKDIIASNQIGSVLSVTSNRLNLGKFQSAGVIWDLAPHDIALTNYLFNSQPQLLHVQKFEQMQTGLVDQVSAHMMYPSNIGYTLNLSWTSPRKIRTTTIVGRSGMIEYDMMSEQPVVVYDKRAHKSQKDWDHSYNWKTVYEGPAGEPLALMVKEFAEFCLEDKYFVSDGRMGLSVVRTIEEML
ncbi:MAG: Gfo/Idh/MocA family protein [Candidatus Thorarchaeota archaeon]|jgi:predicted dehydrogenase